MRRGAAALMLGFCLAACAAIQQGGPVEQLRKSVDGYNHAYRWKNYQRAAAFLPPDQRAAFVSAYDEDDKKLHVENYQVLKVDLATEDSAKVFIRYRYMLLPSVTVEKRRVVQHWQRIRGNWLLEQEDDSIVDFMALLEEKPGLKKTEESFGGPANPNTEVKVVDPQGRVVRDDAAAKEKPQPGESLESSETP